MKIAYIIPKPAFKGPIMVVHDLVVQMQAHGHQCVVYAFELGSEVSFPCSVEYISFYKSIDFDAYDIVHTHCFRPDLYGFLHKPKKCRAKLITTMHNYILRDLAYEYNSLIACTMGRFWIGCLSRFDRVVTLSHDAQTYYHAYLPDSNLCYVYNTRDLRDLNLSGEDVSAEERDLIMDFKGSDKLIGVNAVLTDRKGIDQLISVLPRMAGYKLLIVGDGKSRSSLEKLSIDLQVQERVMFWGYRKNAYRFLPYYDFFAMTSRSEGFGLTILEAALYRKKLICSDIPIFRELLPGNEACFFSLENLDALLNAFKQAEKDSLMGDRLFERYQSAFSPRCFYDNYFAVYQKIINENGRI